MSTRLLRLVRDAYDLESGDASWRDSLAHALGAEIGDGLGVIAFWHDRAAPESYAEQLGRAVFDTAPAMRDESLTAISRFVDASTALMTPPVTTLSVAAPSDAEALIEQSGLARLGIHDALTLNVLVDEHRGLTLCSPLRAARTLRVAARRRLERAVAHLGAVVRLRHRAATPSVDAASAVFAPSGSLEHTTEPGVASARAMLREAVLAYEHARGEACEPESALARWRALVHGEWSLVDAFDSDGRRFVVALPNAVRSSESTTMRAVESALFLKARGRSNSAIAYELGLSEPTVSRLIRQGQEATGLRGAGELRAVLGDAAGDQAP